MSFVSELFMKKLMFITTKELKVRVTAEVKISTYTTYILHS